MLCRNISSIYGFTNVGHVTLPMFLSFRYTIRVKEELDAQKEEIIQGDNPSIPCEGIDDSKNTNDNSI